MSTECAPVRADPIPPSRDGRDARWAAHRVTRRRELVEATVRAIRKHGAGVGMDEIAAAAATSKTVVYRHLGDRLGVYLAVCESVDARILSQIEEAAAPSGRLREPGPALLTAVIDSYLKLVEHDPELYRFVVRRPQVTLPDGTDPVTGLSNRIAETLATLLERLSQPGALPPAQAQTYSWALVGMVKESADRWLEHPGTVSRTELADHLAALAYRGLAPAFPPAFPPAPAPTSAPIP